MLNYYIFAFPINSDDKGGYIKVLDKTKVKYTQDMCDRFKKTFYSDLLFHLDINVKDALFEMLQDIIIVNILNDIKFIHGFKDYGFEWIGFLTDTEIEKELNSGEKLLLSI